MSAAATLKSMALRHLGPRIVARSRRRPPVDLSSWGLSTDSKGLTWAGHSLQALADTFGTPLHVVNGDRLSDLAARAAAAAEQGMVAYSYKTNPVPEVLSRLHAAGLGAEVISEYELWLALRLGVPPSQIVYNGPAKSIASLRTAVSAGVGLINANSWHEMQVIGEVSQDVGHVGRVGVRVSFGATWGGQFGMPLHTEQLEAAVRYAIESPHLELVGLHVHRGGTMRREDEWVAHVTNVLDAVASLRERTGWQPSVIDYGGSLACPTSIGIDSTTFRLHRALGTDLLPPDPSDALAVDQAWRLAHQAARSRFADQQPPSTVLEPGRALTGASQLMLCRVVSVKDDVSPVHVILDGGSNLADPLPHEFHQLLSVEHPLHPGDVSYRLVGPICTPADVLYYHWRLPQLRPGDVVAVLDTGAYFVPFSTAFSFPRPGIVMLDGDQAALIRRHETFADLTHLDRGFA